MAKFFVGQRVRIKISYNWPELAGKEGRVICLGVMIHVGVNKGMLGMAVAPDCWGTNVAPYTSPLGAKKFTPSADQLSPIVPDGHRAGEEGTCEPLDKLLSEVTCGEV